jgi:hypothetical protein
LIPGGGVTQMGEKGLVAFRRRRITAYEALTATILRLAFAVLAELTNIERTLMWLRDLANSNALVIGAVGDDRTVSIASILLPCLAQRLGPVGRVRSGWRFWQPTRAWITSPAE